jgi:hypothetical protein
MKFTVLKDVIIDGHSYPAGAEVDISHDKTSRLEMLGYIEVAKPKTTRSFGLEGDEKPRTRRTNKGE